MASPSKRAPIQIDEVLEGRYRILKLLAEGGMGSVYLAEHMLIKRRVAIKVLHPQLATDGHVVDCFLNEARAAGMLGHPNIVESTDMGFTQDHIPYIVFEYLEGSLLTDEIYRVAGMPMRRAIRIAEQIAGAMHVAHEAGIVHRDLKSDNIFLTDKDDESDHVKVLDFGIARVMDGNDERRSMVVGTPEFMAPEQMTHPDQVDRRADIYALGVILYEMLTARRPFTPGKDVGELQRQILQDRPAPLARPEIPTALSELIIDRMLAKYPSHRPQTMSEVAAALDAFMTREDGSTMPRRRSVPLPTVKPEDIGRDSATTPRSMGMLHTPYPTLETAPVALMPPPTRRPIALYTVAGLSLVVGALGVTWGLKGSSKPDAPAIAQQPLPAAAIPPSAPSKPTEPEKVAVSVESDAPNAHVVFRRRVASAPMATEIPASEIVELVEVSAPGYKTERYWLTLDRATHLKAHLAKGSGLDEASEEATLTALGEVSQPAIATAAPAPAPTKVAAAAPTPAPRETPAPAVAAVKPAPAPVAAPKETPAPVVAVAKTVEKPTTAARLAPRKIGRSAEAPTSPQVASSEEPRPAFADAPPKELPAPPAPAPAAAPVAVQPQPVTSEVARPAVAVSPAAVQPPHNISPAAFRSLRVSGNAEIEAPVTVAKQMVRDSKAKATAAVKACVSLTGDVTTASLIKSSGYPEYDRVLLDGVRSWKFKSGDAVCSAVTFAYKP